MSFGFKHGKNYGRKAMSLLLEGSNLIPTSLLQF